MSTILDALRRLEKDSDRTEDSGPPASWLEAPSVDEPALGKAAGFLLSRSRTFWVVCAGLLCLVGVLAAAGIGVLPRAERRDLPPEKAAGPEPHLQRPPGKTGAPAAQRVVTGRTTAQHPPGRSTEKPAPAPANRAPAATGPATGAARKPPSAAPVAGRLAVSETSGRIAAKKTEPVRAPPPAAETGQTVADSGGKTEAIESLPAGVGFALQAVSWSEDPARRIAVINGSILKEGEKLEDYTVFEISRDDVIFQHQGQRWRLEFRKK